VSEPVVVKYEVWWVCEKCGCERHNHTPTIPPPQACPHCGARGQWARAKL